MAPLIEWLFLRSWRSHGRRDAATGETILEYGRGLRVFGLFGTALFVFFGILAVGTMDRSTGSDRGLWIVLALLIPWLGAGMALAAECFLAMVRVSHSGLRRHSSWTGDLSLVWEEIESVRYSAFSRWYVVGSPRGKMRISSYLNGITDFVELARQKTPPDKWHVPVLMRVTPSRARVR